MKLTRSMSRFFLFLFILFTFLLNKNLRILTFSFVLHEYKHPVTYKIEETKKNESDEASHQKYGLQSLHYGGER